MNRRTAGVYFCLIATILYVGRYISAAIFGSGVSSWNKRLFNAMLQYVGDELKILSIFALIIGITYLVISEITKE